MVSRQSGSPVRLFYSKGRQQHNGLWVVTHPLIILFSSNKNQYNHVLLIRVIRKERYNENHQITFGEFPTYLFGYG